MIHLYVESKKAEFIKTESRIVVTRDWAGEGIGEMLLKGTHLEKVDK